MATIRNTIRVIIPGYGQPHADKKQAIFNSNITLLAQTCPPGNTLDVHVHIYDDTNVPQDPIIPDVNPDVTLTIHREPGIVGEFIGKHASALQAANSQPEPQAKPTHILMLLDDVELQPSFNLAQAIQIQEYCLLNILSPTLTDESATFYPYMRSSYGPLFSVGAAPPASQLPPGNAAHPPLVPLVPLVRITSACEMFCYLMPTPSFMAWCAHLDPANPWLWGMDLLLTYKFKFRVGMVPFMTATHHFQSLCYDAHPDIKPFERFHAYLAKYGETQESLSHLPAIVTTVPLIT